MRAAIKVSVSDQNIRAAEVKLGGDRGESSFNPAMLSSEKETDFGLFLLSLGKSL
ncbi:MAG TPA: hypothetical protein V6D10_20410 [Trichocoleus sp.]|jgi:hypothetical protein